MRHPRSIMKDAQGGVLILTAFSMFLLFAVSGAAIDFGRFALIQLRAQQAADAAALAVAIMPSGVSDAQRNETVKRYFGMNYPDNYLGVSIPGDPASGKVSPSYTPDISVTVRDIAMPTSFIRLVGINHLTIRATNRILASINAASDYDLVVLFDETFSTHLDVTGKNYVGSSDPTAPVTDPAARITQMRDAVKNYVTNVILPPGISNPNVRIGFVGYSSHITSKWGLSSNRADAIAAVDQFRPVCNNYDHVGLQAARNMLLGGGSAPNGVTPPLLVFGFDCKAEANTDVPAPRTARSDGKSISDIKHVLFITDGDIMTEVSPCADDFDGRPVASGFADCVFTPSHPIGDPSKRDFTPFIDACNAIKAMPGAHVFVVIFATPPGNAETAMQQCASLSNDPDYATKYPSNPYKSDYYFAKDAAELNSTLTNIAASIKKVKIVK